jgi:GT2 family glycosyltransferase
MATPLVSALIVNHNSGGHLRECVDAFFKSSDVPVEVVVVDSNSKDGSPEGLEREFEGVRVLHQRRNTGFVRAANVGLQECHGRFVLLLSPHVTVAPACAGRLADFLLVRPDAGAVGPRVRRTDGSLDPDARRGFPTPATAFYRLTGLSHAFRHSRRFNRYELGHLAETEVHEMEAGTAACLMLRRAAIDQVGFLDPAYGMNGADLDLCYRLKQGGWKVFYLPTALAVRAKAPEPPSVRQRLNYQFSQSMWTFHHKHYAEDMPAFANGLVWASIWARWAALSAADGVRRRTRSLRPLRGGEPHRA